MDLTEVESELTENQKLKSKSIVFEIILKIDLQVVISSFRS
jgi:hypothetical protein